MLYLLTLMVLTSLSFGQAFTTPAPPAAETPAERTTILDSATNPLPDLPPLPNGKATVIGGRIRSVDRVRDQLTVDVFGGRGMKILFDERTQVYRDGQKVSLGDLRNGDHVSLETTLDQTAVFARSIHMLTHTVKGECTGQVLKLDRSRGELVVRDSLSPEPIRLQIDAGTTIVGEGQETTAPTDLQVGALVSLRFQPSRSGKRLVSSIAILAAPGSAFVFNGVVSFLDLHTGTLVVLDPRDQKRYEISFDPRLPAADSLHDGSEVTVTAAFDGTRYTAKAITVNSAFAK